jgi:hypothetical protein
MRKGEEGCSIETAMYSVYVLNQERNHVTKSHVKIQFTVYRVNQGARLTEDIPRDWAISVSDNGWTSIELRVDWLKHFIKHTEGKVVEARRLLILDGHESHQSLEFRELCSL